MSRQPASRRWDMECGKHMRPVQGVGEWRYEQVLIRGDNNASSDGDHARYLSHTDEGVIIYLSRMVPDYEG